MSLHIRRQSLNVSNHLIQHPPVYLRPCTWSSRPRGDRGTSCRSQRCRHPSMRYTCNKCVCTKSNTRAMWARRFRVAFLCPLGMDSSLTYRAISPMQQLVTKLQPSWSRLYCKDTIPVAQKRPAAMLQPRGAAKFRKVPHMEVRCRGVGAWGGSRSVLGSIPQKTRVFISVDSHDFQRYPPRSARSCPGWPRTSRASPRPPRRRAGRTRTCRGRPGPFGGACVCVDRQVESGRLHDGRQ